MTRTTLITLCLALAALAPLAAQNRYALVIGNTAYRSFGSLTNPVNDAEDIAAALTRLGYSVDLRRNLGINELDEAVSDYTAQLAANPANEGFFWYAGHGIQLSDSGNYLIPVDFPNIEDRPENRPRITRAAYALNDLLAALEAAGNRANVVVLDACRNNPLAGSGRGGASSRGLGMVANTPPDLIIMYSTAAGAAADDGAAGKRNSPFAEAFLKNIDKPEPIALVMADITGETLSLTANRQRPYQAGTIVNRNYSLNPNAAAYTAPSLPVPAAAPETKRLIPIPKTMAFVQGGSFTMGSGGDVIRINSFVIGKNEVTEGDYEAVMGKNPSKNPRGAAYPVENVSWFDAVEYCNRLSVREGLTPAYTGSGVSVQCDFSANGYRLPTEAEWEFAAKGGIVASRLYRYAGSDTLADVGWYQARGQTSRSKHPVGQKKANALGLYDMSGNVYEWCEDWENPPSGLSSKDARRAVRGGAYCYSEANAEVTSRFGVRPGDWGEYIGFRVARNE